MFFRARAKSSAKRTSGQVEARGRAGALLTHHLQQQAPALAAHPLDVEQSLFTAGLLDSLQFAELVTFIAETFGVDLWADPGVSPQELDTVASMVEAIEQRLSSTSP